MTDNPNPAVFSAALALAENEGTPITQAHLREATTVIEAYQCPEDGCLLPRGHDCDCLPVLEKLASDREELIKVLTVLGELGTVLDFPETIQEQVTDVLAEHGQDI